MIYLVMVLLLAGCSFNLSLGTTTQQVRSKFVCDDVASKTLDMSLAFRRQAEFATTEEERAMMTRVSDGFFNDYRELMKKETCWVKP